jgi:hypothetical protein
MGSFEHLLHQLHLSYLQARKNKRNTHNQLKFEMHQETQLYDLAKEIYERKYTPKPCIAFIIHKPVMREIFAADFIDRVIHHLIYRCIYPHIDRRLINDTYSCREEKGTLYGINRAKGFMNSCSQDFTKETYFLKLDIEAYFMNMQHETVYNKVQEMLPKNKQSFLGISKETLLYLLHQTIFNTVSEKCRIKGSRSDWVGLKVHPNKIVLKSIDDGIPFLGQIIKPHRCYIGNRTKNNFYQAIQEINKIMAVVREFSWQQLCEIRTTLNSYLGYMQHANSFKLRKVMLGRLIKRFYDFYFVEKKLDKVIINEDFWQWHFSPSYRFIN